MGFLHFKGLLEKDVCDQGDIDIVIESGACILYRPISRDEVLTALRKLKNTKSAGPVGIIGEMFKNSGDLVIDFF